jgi:hypothetical protein
MQANAALYLPAERVDLADVFPGTRAAGGIFSRNMAFEVPFKDTYVRFNVMPARDVAEHLRQFVAYVESLEDAAADKEAAKDAITKARTVLGLQTELEFEGNEELGNLLEQINDRYKGCLFMFDSVVLHGGDVLVGPLKSAT